MANGQTQHRGDQEERCAGAIHGGMTCHIDKSPNRWARDDGGLHTRRAEGQRSG